MMRLLNLLLRPYILALIIAIPVIVFIPPVFEKYELNVVKKATNEFLKNVDEQVIDLDGDGNSEFIYSFQNWEGHHSILVKTHDGGLLEEWGFDGNPLPRGERFFCADLENDGFKEILVMCLKNDSVWLHCISPFNIKHSIRYKDIFLFSVNWKYEKPDPYLTSILLEDIDNDGNKELVFGIVSGRAKFPRGVYLYDFDKNEIIRSPDWGTYLNNLIAVDLDNDGDMEILGSTSAGGNIQDSLGVPITDYSAWVIAFDHHLQPLFDPIAFEGFGSEVHCLPYHSENEVLISAFYAHKGAGTNIPELMLIDRFGKVKNSFVFEKMPKQNFHLYIPNKQNGGIYLLSGLAKLWHFDADLNPVVSVLGEFPEPLQSHGLKEWQDHPSKLVLSFGNTFCISNPDFRNISMLDLKPEYEIHQTMVFETQNAKQQLLYVPGKENNVILSYTFNPYYWLRFPFYVGVFLGIWLFILFIRKLQLIQIQKNERIRSQIVELQLKNTKNQMNPHFTFNVFNSIAAIIQKESATAYTPFMKFSNLIRSTLEASDKISRSLEDEINYLKNFLELEQLRFPDKFDYEFKIHDEINLGVEVPKMLLQTYVENSLKHGILPGTTKGLIQITIEQDKNDLIITVTDNGIGRQKAKELNTGTTGFGLQIMENYFKLFNEYNTNKIRWEIRDAMPNGTEVEVRIPGKFRFAIGY